VKAEGVVLFSIIIPTKDRPVLLIRALRSALAQSDPAYEIIIVDDGDGSGARTAQALESDQVHIFSTGASGQVPARNLGVSNARGRWIAFLDDDDWWADEHHLRDFRAVLSDECLAYCSGRIVLEAGSPLPLASIAFDAFMDHRSVFHDNTLLVPGIAYPRHLHETLGFFDESLPYYWDWDWYLRLAAAGITFCRSPGGGVRVTSHAHSVSGVNGEAERGKNLARLIDKHKLSGVTLKNHLSIALESVTRAPV
jgi:glycosyltransferase involved in cell wall biosynthesis